MNRISNATTSDDILREINISLSKLYIKCTRVIYAIPEVFGTRSHITIYFDIIGEWNPVDLFVMQRVVRDFLTGEKIVAKLDMNFRGLLWYTSGLFSYARIIEMIFCNAKMDTRDPYIIRYAKKVFDETGNLNITILGMYSLRKLGFSNTISITTIREVLCNGLFKLFGIRFTRQVRKVDVMVMRVEENADQTTLKSASGDTSCFSEFTDMIKVL